MEEAGAEVRRERRCWRCGRGVLDGIVRGIAGKGKRLVGGGGWDGGKGVGRTFAREELDEDVVGVFCG